MASYTLKLVLVIVVLSLAPRSALASQADTLVVSPDTARVSTPGTWTLKLAFSRVLTQGAVISVEVPRWWQIPQLVDTTVSGYVKVWTQSGSVSFTKKIIYSNLDALPGYTRAIQLTILSGSLSLQDTIYVKLGQERMDTLGIKPNPFAGKQAFRAMLLSPPGSKVLSAPVLVFPRSMFVLRVIAPSVVQPGEKFPVRVAAVDANGNRDWRYTDNFIASTTDPLSVLPATVLLQESDSGTIAFPASLNSEGFHQIRLRDKQGRFWVSNPVWCKKSVNERVFWGDPHSHCVISNHGYGIPDDLFSYARRISALDWVVYSEHDYLSATDYAQYVVQLSNVHSKTGEFVTLIGLEYTGDPRWLGHLNIYFQSAQPAQINYAMYSSIPALMEALKRHGGIAQINHPFRPVVSFNQWEQIDTSVVRNVEMVNEQESYEFPLPGASGSIRQQLNQGFALGFVGSSDNHLAHAGTHWTTSKFSALTAVLCDSLTRQSVFNALRQRKTYASNGIRPLIDFTVNATPIGSTVRLRQSDSPVITIAGKIGAASTIDSLRVTKKGGTLLVLRPRSNVASFTASDTLHGNSDFYYLVVSEEGGGRAWTSPIIVIREDTLTFAAPLRALSPRSGDTLKIDTLMKLKFTWSAFRFQNLGDTTRYSLRVFGSSIDTAIAGIKDTSVEMSFLRRLRPSSIYSWYVMANNGRGTVISSDTASFVLAGELSHSGPAILLPKDFVLYQSFPNPFNSSTEISYALPVASSVRISVYDLLGRIVHELVNSSMQAGFHIARWNANNVPSGVYFLRMEAEGREAGRPQFTATVKAVVIR